MPRSKGASGPDLLIVSPYLSPPPGGIQRLALDIFLAFSDRDVRLVAVSSAPSPDPRIRIVHLREGRFGGARTLAAFAWASLAELRRRPALVHAMSWRAAVPLLMSKRQPTALYCHGAELVRAFKGRPEVALRRRVLHAMTGIVANSHFTANLVREVGERNATIVHPTLPRMPELQTRGPRANDTIQVLGVGRLVIDKGFDRLLRVVAEVRQRGIEMELTIAGTGPEHDALLKLSADLGIADSVRIVGHIPDAELEALYRTTDIFALLSVPFDGEVEGFGIVYIEAASYGLPVVAGSCGGIPDAVAHGETGYLTDTEDDAVTALVELARDPARRAELGAKGRARAETFLMPHFKENLAAFYEECTTAFAAGRRL